MPPMLPRTFVVDPTDPRAPTQDEWDRMAPEERMRVVAMLPTRPPLDQQPPDECRHLNTGTSARHALDVFFRRTNRDIFVSSGLAVYYPGEPRFSPDVLAVVDVERRPRTRWVVSQESKGLDLVLEMHVEGDREQDRRRNLERYARLGITEFFLFDCHELRLEGHRLDPGARRYRPILPQQGRYASEVLGLDFMLEGPKLRILNSFEPLPEAEEILVQLGDLVDALAWRHRDDMRRAAAESQRFHWASQRADAAGRQVAELERDLAELRQDLERLKRGA